MSDYFGLLRQKEVVSKKIRVAEREAHVGFVLEHKCFVRLLDLCMVVILFCNLGALVMTNMMVAKVSPGVEVLEVNPIAARVYGVAQHPQLWSIVKAFLFHSFFWVLIIGVYLYQRWTVCCPRDLWILGVMVLFWLVIFGLDFLNDFGYVLGKIVYGG